MLSVRHIDARNFASGNALVEPLALVRNTLSLLSGGSRQSFGDGEVSRKAFDFLCQSCHDLDIGFNSVCYRKRIIHRDRLWIADFLLIRHLSIPLSSDSSKKAELADCFSDRFVDCSGDEFYRQLEIHLSEGNFQREWHLFFWRCLWLSSHWTVTKTLNQYLIFFTPSGVEAVRFFICKKLRYIWDVQSSSFTKLKGLDENVPSFTIHKQKPMSEYTRSVRWGWLSSVFCFFG